MVADCERLWKCWRLDTRRAPPEAQSARAPAAVDRATAGFQHPAQDNAEFLPAELDGFYARGQPPPLFVGLPQSGLAGHSGRGGQVRTRFQAISRCSKACVVRGLCVLRWLWRADKRVLRLARRVESRLCSTMCTRLSFAIDRHGFRLLV